MCENETFTITSTENKATDVDIAMRTDGSSDDQISVGEIEKIHSLFDSVSSKTVPFTSVYTSEELIKLEKLLHKYKEFLAASYSFMSYISVLYTVLHSNQLINQLIKNQRSFVGTFMMIFPTCVYNSCQHTGI